STTELAGPRPNWPVHSRTGWSTTELAGSQSKWLVHDRTGGPTTSPAGPHAGAWDAVVVRRGPAVREAARGEATLRVRHRPALAGMFHPYSQQVAWALSSSRNSINSLITRADRQTAVAAHTA